MYLFDGCVGRQLGPEKNCKMLWETKTYLLEYNKFTTNVWIRMNSVVIIGQSREVLCIEMSVNESLGR